jgi:hypothetical protein
MAEEALAIGGGFLIFGFALNVASPQLSPLLNANLGLWGAFFAIIGLIVIAIRLKSMGRR